MKLFLDTAHIEDIRRAAELGVISGVTTNPSLIARESGDFSVIIREIVSIVDGPVFGEVNADTTDTEGMVREGREIASIDPHMVVKLPTTPDGLRACHRLASEGIRCNMTLVFSANQALLAQQAGASYCSPFIGRLDDISYPGVELIETIAGIFDRGHGSRPEIIAASVRNPVHVIDCALAGADIATVPYSVIEQMMRHPLTDAGLAKFQADAHRAANR